MKYKDFKDLQRRCEEAVDSSNPPQSEFAELVNGRRRAHRRLGFYTLCVIAIVVVFVLLETWSIQSTALEVLYSILIGGFVLAIFLQSFEGDKLQNASKRQRAAKVIEMMATASARGDEGTGGSPIVRAVLWWRGLLLRPAGLLVLVLPSASVVWVFLGAQYLSPGMFYFCLASGVIALIFAVNSSIRHGYRHPMVGWALTLGLIGPIALANVF